MELLLTRPRLSAAMLACSLLLITPSSDIEPQERPNFPLISQISAMDGGYGHTCAVTTGGKVICWGDNSSGELGIGTFEQRLVPVEVTRVSDPVTTVVTGSALTCVLTASSRVKCWGSNLFGELGDGPTAYRSLPGVVPNLESDVEIVAAGFAHTCAVLDNSQVSCWGWNYSGQLGRGVKSTGQKPSSVIGLEGRVCATAAVPASPPAQTPRQCCLPRPAWRILSRSVGTDGE